MMALTSKDTVFENTYPAPNGERFEGKEKVRIFWENFFHTSISAQIEIEEIFSFSERCVMFWNYHWKNHHGEAGHIRGVDVYRIENKLIAEKRSYVKG